MPSSKYSTPVRLRAKVALPGSVSRKQAISQRYLSGQASADPENKLAPQVAALVAARQSLGDKLTKKVEARSKLTLAQADVILAIDTHDVATKEYARAAAKLAGSDISLLTTLGVDAAATIAKGEHDEIEAPQGLTVSPGGHPGEARVKCAKVNRAVAYVFEYKLEPSQPTALWLPEGGILTSRLSALIFGLAPSQPIRVRARAIGGTASPWSEEVIGRAR